MPKFDGRMLTVHPPCYYCKHRTHVGSLQNDEGKFEGWLCSAFPDGIPNPILTRADGHDKVHPLQEGDAVYESKVYEFSDGKQIITFDGEWVDA